MTPADLMINFIEPNVYEKLVGSNSSNTFWDWRLSKLCTRIKVQFYPQREHILYWLQTPRELWELFIYGRYILDGFCKIYRLYQDDNLRSAYLIYKMPAYCADGIF